MIFSIVIVPGHCIQFCLFVVHCLDIHLSRSFLKTYTLYSDPVKHASYYGSVFRTSGKKILLICPGKIIILPGQDNRRLICPAKIIILPGQDNCRLSCPGKIIILPGQDNHTLSCPGKITTH